MCARQLKIGLRVDGLEFGAECCGFEFQSVMFDVTGLGFGVQGLGIRAERLVFGVYGLGIRVELQAKKSCGEP